MSNHCPVPNCQQAIAADQFMCGPHRRMMSPAAAARIQHCKNLERRTDLDDVQRLETRKALRIALALAFAEVCEQEGIDPQSLGQPQGLKPTPLAQALGRILQ